MRLWYSQLPDLKTKQLVWVRVASNGRLNDADFARYQVRQTDKWYEVAADSAGAAKAKLAASDFVATCDATTAPAVVRNPFKLHPRTAEEVSAEDEKAPLLGSNMLRIRMDAKVLAYARANVANIPMELSGLRNSTGHLAERKEDCLQQELDHFTKMVKTADATEAEIKTGKLWVKTLDTRTSQWLIQAPDGKQYALANAAEKCDVRVQSGVQILRYKLLKNSALLRKTKADELVLDHAVKVKAAKKASKKLVEPDPVAEQSEDNKQHDAKARKNSKKNTAPAKPTPRKTGTEP